MAYGQIVVISVIIIVNSLVACDYVLGADVEHLEHQLEMSAPELTTLRTSAVSAADDLVFWFSHRRCQASGALVAAISISEVCTDSRMSAKPIALSHQWLKRVDCVSPRRNRCFLHERYATPAKTR